MVAPSQLRPLTFFGRLPKGVNNVDICKDLVKRFSFNELTCVQDFGAGQFEPGGTTEGLPLPEELVSEAGFRRGAESELAALHPAVEPPPASLADAPAAQDGEDGGDHGRRVDAGSRAETTCAITGVFKRAAGDSDKGLPELRRNRTGNLPRRPSRTLLRVS
ncbi:hypothetical protein MTO96_010101 [Rhipicephalus appendiculatus]